MDTDFAAPKNKQNLENLSKIKKAATLSVGVLNGVIGDYLDNKNNGLTVQMQFYKNEKPLILSRENINSTHQKITSKICILIHGLTNDETIWNLPNTKQENYGTLLQKELNYTPFYIRYNTGLHISENGKQFSQLIETLVNNYPIEIDEISIIAHSMGGLVTRSACYYAPLQNANWLEKVHKLFFLGTPHLGAPLEKFGNALTFLLKEIPISYTQISGDIINLRSAGIKDLRYGYIIDEDWKNHHPDELLKNNKNVIPLLEDVEYYIISGTLTKDPNHLVSEWFGDILVRKDSAKGKSKSKHHLAFDFNHHKEFSGVAHLKIVDSIDVYEQIKTWISKKSEHKKSIKTRNPKSIIPYNTDYFPKGNNIINDKFTSILKLTTTGLIGTIDKLETINKNNLTYKILNQIPIVNTFSKEIENIQKNITETILSTSKSILKKANNTLE